MIRVLGAEDLTRPMLVEVARKVMTPEQFTVWRLRLPEPMSWPEISRTLNLPVGTARGRHDRGQAALEIALVLGRVWLVDEEVVIREQTDAAEV